MDKVREVEEEYKLHMEYKPETNNKFYAVCIYCKKQFKGFIYFKIKKTAKTTKASPCEIAFYYRVLTISLTI